MDRAAADAAPSSSGSFTEGRFVPGVLLAARYRIVGLLGKGGMGEVYRADDLKLGQAVALKFLPVGFEKDAEHLSRLINEVKTARQISHPNVCRVYDIGEVDGQHFLTMEYVDGEDLASLLRRIGRLPRDKAIQMARQMCAGLAAAHEQGILHRDFKPSNVMIDGRGRVRVTDFGLAALAASLGGLEVRAGTPAYMAPEQTTGRGVSVKSDLYSLGLVLYEVFTGRPAFQAATPAELARLQKETTPATPSSLVEGIDPAVERAILRCLEKDPRERPTSALAVAASLPGGDPLAAALAAGETPSPEMVADAGEIGGLAPATGWACLGFVLVALVLTILGSDQTMMARLVPLAKPPEALADRARDIISRLGYPDPPVDSAFGLDSDADYIRYVEQHDTSPRRWEGLASGRPAAVYFWYRQSPRDLEPKRSQSLEVRPDDPPEDVSGMAHVVLDPKGRLTEFVAVPPQLDDSRGPWSEPVWVEPFAQAGLDVATFVPTEPRWNPPVYSDRRAAWQGVLPDTPHVPVRIEASAYHGRPVYFQILGAWTRPDRMQPFEQAALAKAAGIIFPTVAVMAIVAGALLARRNLRLGRGDRRAAFRLAACVFLIHLVSWLLLASHVSTVSGEFNLFFGDLAFGVLITCIAWLFYIALEPYVRRRWPNMIISWTRLLAGRYRDPLVGRDLLMGGVFGAGLTLLDALYHLSPRWLGLLPQAPHPIEPGALLGMSNAAGGILRLLAESGLEMLLNSFLLVLLRIVLRKQWLAAAAFFLFLTFTNATGAGNPLINLVYAALSAAVVTRTLIRFGLLAAIVTRFVYSLVLASPLTSDLSVWYAGNSLFGLAIALAPVVYGLYLSLAGRPLFREALLET